MDLEEVGAPQHTRLREVLSGGNELGKKSCIGSMPQRRAAGRSRQGLNRDECLRGFPLCRAVET